MGRAGVHHQQPPRQAEHHIGDEYQPVAEGDDLKITCALGQKGPAAAAVWRGRVTIHATIDSFWSCILSFFHRAGFLRAKP